MKADHKGENYIKTVFKDLTQTFKIISRVFTIILRALINHALLSSIGFRRNKEN